MAVRLVSSGGLVIEPAAFNFAGSGVIKAGSVVEFSRTAGLGVTPASSSSTFTNVFGVAHDYAQGASDVQIRVTPIVAGQLWEIDCVEAASTAQVGLRHALRDHLLLKNDATDVTGATGVFRVLAITGATTGSGKVIGEFVRANVPQFGFTTFA